MSTFNTHTRTFEHGTAAVQPVDPVLSHREDRVAPADSASPVNANSSASGGSVTVPLLIPAEEAFAAIGVGRTKGFQLIRNGHLIARKLGSRTLVEVESLTAFVAALPFVGGRP